MKNLVAYSNKSVSKKKKIIIIIIIITRGVIIYVIRYTSVVLREKETMTAFQGSSVSGDFVITLFGSHLRVAVPLHTLIFVGAHLES